MVINGTDNILSAREVFRQYGEPFRGSKLHEHLTKIARAEGWPTHKAALARLKQVDFAINERAGYARQIAKNAEGGRIAVCRSGMDCDCVQYSHVTHIDVPVSLFAYVRNEHEHEQYLDGPESSSFGKPSECPEEYLSSDRALAAFEDGHPSTVTWADRSEMHAR